MITYELKATGVRDAFYKVFLLLRDGVKISASELKVLSDIAYFNWRYNDMDDEEKAKILLSYPVRQYIRDKWKFSEQGLNNLIYALRKKKVIVKDLLNKKYQIDIKDYLEIKFLINIKDEQDKKSVFDRG